MGAFSLIVVINLLNRFNGVLVFSESSAQNPAKS